MRVFVTGATGLVGRRLVADRLQRGDQVVVLTRNGARARGVLAGDDVGDVEVVEGDPATAGVWQEHVSGCEAVVHLAGAGVGDRRWNAAYKKVLVDSRVESTLRVAEAIDAAADRPSVLVCASATGYYGVCDSPVDETAAPGDDFLARLSVRWEEAAQTATGSGARVVHARLGIVLDERGGALARMVPLFRWMVGGPLGSGRQHMPWVHWRDVAGLVDLALRDGRVSGPVNVVAPDAVTSRAFARALGRVLGRPSWMAAPRFGLRIAVGELASFMTMSQHVVPRKARDLGYEFAFAELGPALEDLLRYASRAGH
ncbi:MAG: TIGR01777 family oxidoreductase [Planctomycetota bacterium]|jgi:uncharacterized protein (TIGR01777 family)